MVEVAVLAKNMTKERIDIQIDQQHLRVVIRDAEGQQEYELDVDLYGQVSYFSFLSPSPVGLPPPPPLSKYDTQMHCSCEVKHPAALQALQITNELMPLFSSLCC